MNDTHQWGHEKLTVCYGVSPLPGSLSARIPLEVIEAVIESGAEVNILCTCALVCRSWHVCSTKKLYRSIVITSHTNFERLSASARRFPRVRERLTQTRRVDIRNSAQVFPLVLGRYLPNVEQLVFGECCMSLPIHPSFFFTLSQLASVTALTLYYGFELLDFSEFRSMVSRFPLLTDLSISYISFKRYLVTPNLPAAGTAQASASPALRIQLRSLELTGLCATILYPLLDWLITHDVTCRLVSKVRIALHDSVEDVNRIQRLLHISGTSLTDCQLNLRLEGEYTACALRRTEELTLLTAARHTQLLSQPET